MPHDSNLRPLALEASFLTTELISIKNPSIIRNLKISRLTVQGLEYTVWNRANAFECKIEFEKPGGEGDELKQLGITQKDTVEKVKQKM